MYSEFLRVQWVSQGEDVKTVIYYICFTTKQIEGRQMIWSCYLLFGILWSVWSQWTNTNFNYVHIISRPILLLFFKLKLKLQLK